MALHPRGIDLVRHEPVGVNVAYLGAFRIRIEAVNAFGPDLDNNVFVYVRRPSDPYTGLSADKFTAIAGPVDMSAIPVGEPDPHASYPFFRQSFVELDFRSTTEAEETWSLIQQQVAILLTALGQLEQLDVTQEVHLGDVAPESESLSESLSE